MQKTKQHKFNGFLVVNKPQGMTSHDVVARARKILGMRRIGHAGTLDPLATGVLVLLLGRGTKTFNQFEAFDKAYKASLILGIKTTTADIQGEVTQEMPYNGVTQDKVCDVLKCFVGQIEQIPPMVSAVKHKGKRLYELARKGIEVARKPRLININRLDLLDFVAPNIAIYVECSKGTYIRQLAEDIGDKLGTVACVSQIERTKVGPFSIDEAVNLDSVSKEHVRDLEELPL